MAWLVGKATRRDFESFVAAATAPLLRTAYLMTWDRSEAEDLVQETFIKVVRHWSRVRTMEQPVAYARRILTNLTLDGGARRARLRIELTGEVEAITAVAADPVAERAVIATEYRRDIDAALAALPTHQRAVLVLRFWDDCSLAEIAEILGCSTGTVKSAISRGLGRLRQLMGVTSPPDGDSKLAEVNR